jgi:hypothetical protein
VLPEIGQQIRRDREEEMRHRGTAYMRAIQHFYKKFGRYPSRIEELENTNNLRFIRKRYKDPIIRDAAGHERDFKLLHQTDISLNNGPVLGQTPGQGLFPGQGGPQGPSGFGGAPGGLGGLPGGLGGLGAQPGGLQQAGNSGAQTPASGDSANPSSADPSSGNSSDTGGNSNSPGSSPSGSSSSGSNTSSNSGPGFNGPTFGGGPILGVASTSKEKSIRVFYEKNHYNDWLFIYLPQGDRGGLLTGPVSLNGPTGNLGGTIPGQPVSPGPGFTPITGAPGAPQQPPQNPGQTPPEQ